MMEDPKPASPLTAERIKRGAAPIVLEAALQPDAEAALRREARELVTVNAGDDFGVAGERFDVAETRFDVAATGLLNWRRAGFFGLVYLGALAAFAAAFAVLP